MHSLSTILRALWDRWGELPSVRCSLYTPSLVRHDRLGNLLIFLAYSAYPLLVARALYRIRPLSRPHFTLASLLAVFVVSCGTTHLLRITTGYIGGLELEIVVLYLTAFVSWAAVVALHAAVQRMPVNSPLAALALPPVARAVVRVRAFVIATLAALALLYVGRLTYRQTVWLGAEVEERRKLFDHASAVSHQLMLMCDAETGQRGYLLTGEIRYLAPYREALGAMQASRSHAIEPWLAVDEKLAELDETIRLYQSGDKQGALSLVRTGKGKLLMDRVRFEAISREADIRATMATRDANVAHSLELTHVFVPTVGSIAFLSIGASVATIIRDGQRLRASERARANEILARTVAEAAQERAEFAMRTAEREAEWWRQEARAKGESMTAFAHDARTPHNGIGLKVQLIERALGRNAPPRVLDDLADISRLSLSTVAMLNDILDAEKAATDSVKIAPFVVCSFLREVKGAVAGQADAKGIEVKVACPDGFLARSDRAKLYRVLMNLATNAVKFTPKGGSIYLGARGEGTTLHLAVSDTGIGISESALPHLFEAGFQANNPARTPLPSDSPNRGFGYGLWSCRRIVEALGGKIAVEGTEGRGSTFAVSIPNAVGQGS